MDIFSSREWLILIVAIIAGVLFGWLLWRVLRAGEIGKHRADAIKRSQSVILWAVYEKVLPFLPNFPYSPKDMVFIGKGFDYLVLDGLSEWDLKNVIFLEIKSGTSTLNKNEKMIRSTVSARNVRFEEYRI